MDKLDKILSKMTLDEKASALCLDMHHIKTEENARLGIDGLQFAYGAHGLSNCGAQSSGCAPATCFPAPSALGRSWSRACVRQAAQAVAEEAREQNVCAVFAPTLNIKRSLRDTDGSDCFSEDPFLCAELEIGRAHV